MGDRSNVFFVQERTPTELRGVYLYGHWGGQEMQQKALEVLGGEVAKDRWNDDTYLCRIIIHNVLLSMADPTSPTSWGISCMLTDNEYPILVIDCGKQEVRLMSEGDQTNPRATPLKQCSFTDAKPDFVGSGDEDEE